MLMKAIFMVSLISVAEGSPVKLDSRVAGIVIGMI